MHMGNIGIIGRARAGKDTAGQWLVKNRGYRRIGFADPLKEAALKLDPIIDDGNVGYSFNAMRLSELVRGYGWERAKEIGDTRRILQELGAAVRATDEDFWLRAAMKRVMEANEVGVPAVVTDVRYPNEAASLKRAGFHLVYIERPGVEQLVHESEGALTSADATYFIRNKSGDLPGFLEDVEFVADNIAAIESRRHYARSH
ncbi:deoxynucleotide monophosphate kinase family protein [Streptomyces californicus]|uniref:deoxynucleotide monophosphate kinase family protein n=1 Tax=Streptomyces californicus TaxID=67351 RepID=UPI0035DA1EA5